MHTSLRYINRSLNFIKRGKIFQMFISMIASNTFPTKMYFVALPRSGGTEKRALV